MKKALILSGGWEGHEPKLTSKFIAQKMEEVNYKVDISETIGVLDDINNLLTYDVIIPNWTMGEMEHATDPSDSSKINNFSNAIIDGVGLAGWHGGMGDTFRSNTEYQFIVGGQFVAHPGDIKKYEVIIQDKNHKITKGLDNFVVNTEQYFMHTDPSVTILADTSFSSDTLTWINGVKMPVVWTKEWGKGRVFYSSLGHSLNDLKDENILKLTIQGIIWATRV